MLTANTKYTARAACAFSLILLFAAAGHAARSTSGPAYSAPQADIAPIVDGSSTDTVWAEAEWRDIKYRWLGPEYTAQDFAGRFKVVWTPDRLFILTEITDDILYDGHRNPLEQYWDDDCLEIFLDENFSGGNHQFNHNAFAYHVGLDNRTVDIGTDEKPHDYSDHVHSNWKQYDDKIVWEVAIAIYSDDYIDGSTANEAVTLSAGKILGLMLAYCDNDGSALRENFVGSEAIPSGPKDRGWIDADLFGKVVLK